MNNASVTSPRAHAPRARLPIYGVVLVTFALIIGIVAAMGDNDNPRMLYLCVLFAICTSPMLLVDKLNGRYTVLCAFMTFFFIFYGGSDLVDIGSAVDFSSGRSDILSLAEIAILIGAALLAAGYHTAVVLGARRRQAPEIKDWSGSALLIVGLALWGAGLLANWIWQVEVLKRAFGPMQGVEAGETLLLMTARLVQPLGTILIAYRLVAFRNRALYPVVLAVLAVEIVSGFLGDSKELALRGVALMVMARTLIEGRIPKTWLLAATAFILLAFPIFQAYRTEVLGGGRDRGAAAANFQANLEKALGSKKRESGNSHYTSRSLLSRISLKGTMEMVIDRVGTDAKFQNGDTIIIALTAFIPRVIWRDKPDSSVGQLFNRELHISEFRDVYISPSQLGEMYWNFGWTGVVVGMTLLGFVLGFVNSRFDLSRGRSVTRLLVITVTIYIVCMRFETNIAMVLIQWARSVAAIGLLHLIFARTRRSIALA